MKKLLLLVGLLSFSAQAESIYLPNVARNATGTVNNGKNLLDVNVALTGTTQNGGSVATASGGQGQVALAIRHDAAGPLAGISDGQYSQLQVDSSGALKVNATVTEGATVANGGALPAVVKVMAGYDGTAVRVLKTDNTGTPFVTIASLPLPAGAATEATLSTLNGKIPSNLTVTATRLLVDGSGVTQPVSGTVTANIGTSGSLALDATVSSMSAKLPTALGAKTTANSMAVNIASDQTVPVSGTFWQATQPVSGTVTAAQPTAANLNATVVQSGTWTVQPGNTANTTPWLSKLNDGTNSMTIKAGNSAAVAGDTALVVAISPNNSLTTSNQTKDGSGNSITSSVLGASRGLHEVVLGKSVENIVRLDYTGTNVTTAAYTQLIASTSAETQEIEIFDSSGQTLFLAVGGAGSEQNQIYITPGGNGRVPLRIPSGSRVSIKAVSATANAGEIDINLYGY